MSKVQSHKGQSDSTRPWVREIGDVDCLAALQMAMATDGHKQLWHPNLVVLTKSESESGSRSESQRIIGCAGIGTVPYVNVWLDSQRVKARDTVAVIGRFEEIAREKGFAIVAVPCATESPLYPFMTKLGYTLASRPTFLKQL